MLIITILNKPSQYGLINSLIHRNKLGLGAQLSVSFLTRLQPVNDVLLVLKS
jgi:hypothetical protein